MYFDSFYLLAKIAIEKEKNKQKKGPHSINVRQLKPSASIIIPAQNDIQFLR